MACVILHRLHSGGVNHPFQLKPCQTLGGCIFEVSLDVLLELNVCSKEHHFDFTGCRHMHKCAPYLQHSRHIETHMHANTRCQMVK